MKVAKDIQALAIAGVLAVSLSGAPDMKVCDFKGACQTITKTEYRTIKTGLAEKIEADTPLEWSEMEVLTAVLDFEAKKNGAMQLGPISSQEDLKAKITAKLYEN